MKSIYCIIFGAIMASGLLMVGCGAPPSIPVNATDGGVSSITVDWSNWEAAGATGPYTVLRATNPGMTGAAAVDGGCAGSQNGTSCDDADSLVSGKVYFYTITDSTSDTTPAEGGFIGSADTTLDPSAWMDALLAATTYHSHPSNPDACPGVVGSPYAECEADCLDGGNLTMSLSDIPDTGNFEWPQTANNCDTGDYVIDTDSITGGGMLGIHSKTTYVGYIIGNMEFTHQTGSNSGQIYFLQTMVVDGFSFKYIDPSTGFITVLGDWSDTTYVDLSTD